MTITSLNISEGTVGRRNRSKFKLIALVVVVVLAIICLSIGLSIAFRSKKKECPVHEFPTLSLPPSASKLRVFKKAAVCADGAICAGIGMSILKKNGSAVDAAIATLFCNGVYTMQSMGLGGGFLATIYIRGEKKGYTLNARETAPGKADPELYRSNKMTSQKGPLAIAVPGELRGYWAAHKKFGRLSWKELVIPTVELCEKGYQMSQHQYIVLRDNLTETDDPNFKEWFWTKDGKRKALGSLVRPTKLCESLKIIAEEGGDSLYNGTLAKRFVEDLQEKKAIITSDDLKNYTPEWLDPVTVKLNNGLQMYSVKPPGSGILLAFMLNILNGYNFSPQSIEEVDDRITTYHRIIEAFKYGYAERTEIGDPKFVDMTALLDNLTSVEYADYIRKQISDHSTSDDPKHYGAVYYMKDDHGTAHVSVIAENGDAVSVTSSVNLYYGCGFTSKQTGIIPNSVIDDFSFPFHENYFGLPGSPHNELKPGKRPLSSMTPTIIVDEQGDVKLVVGASGGTKITTAVAWVIIRTLWFGQNVKEAVDAGRIHHQLFPMEAVYEHGLLKQEYEGLKKIGHLLTLKDGGSVICAIMKKAGLIYANADYRKGGDVYGYD